MKMNKQSESQKKYKLYNKFKSICVFCTFLICVSQTSYAQKERAIIYGKVIDQVSGKPILSGTISILRKDKEVGTLKTSIEGIYSAIMIPGNYDFKAYCTGYMSNQKLDINVIDGDSLQLNFSLKERHDFLLGSSPQSELEFLGELQELSNTEVSISNEVIIKSPSIKPSSLSNKAPKKLHVKEKLTIAPAKYDVYRNKGAKSPFRYPVAKIPMVAKNDALEKLIENISKGKLPNDDNELKEIIIEDLVNSMDYNLSYS